MKQFLRSFLYAMKGISSSFREQRNVKVQSLIAIATIGAGFYFSITAIEWCIVLMTIGMVIGLEMINTSIENLVDLVTQEWKPLAGKVKDMAAGGVLVVSVIAVIVGSIIFSKYLLP